MNKKTTILGLLLTITTLLLKADDILDYLADYIEKQNWRDPLQWDGKKLTAEIQRKDQSPYGSQLAAAISSELSGDKKRILIDSFKEIYAKNRELKERGAPSLNDKFALKKKKQYIDNLLFINAGRV